MNHIIRTLPRQPIGARTYSTADVGSWTTGRRTSVESLNKSLIVEPSRCGRIGSSPCRHRLGHSFNDAHGRCFAFSEEGGATLEEKRGGGGTLEERRPPRSDRSKDEPHVLGAAAVSMPRGPALAVAELVLFESTMSPEQVGISPSIDFAALFMPDQGAGEREGGGHGRSQS